MLTFSFDFPIEMDILSSDVKTALEVLEPRSYVGELRGNSDACGKQDNVVVRLEVNWLPKGAFDHRSHYYPFGLGNWVRLRRWCIFSDEALGKTALSLDKQGETFRIPGVHIEWVALQESEVSQRQHADVHELTRPEGAGSRQLKFQSYDLV